MTRFMAIIWDPQDLEAGEAARRLTADPALHGRSTITCQEGLVLADLSGPGSPATLMPIGSTGAVIGYLFKRSLDLTPSSKLTQAPPGLEGRVLETSGECLLEGYWGSYVAFFAGHESCTVLPDPTSSIPCFYMQLGHLTLAFSHLEECPASIRRTLKINHRFVSQVLAYDKIQNGETGLERVRELHAGQALVVTPGGLEETISWDPRRFASAPGEPSISEAAERLLQTTRYVVQSWGKSFPEDCPQRFRRARSLRSSPLCLTDLKEDVDIQGVHFV